jgi:hypothetical protein
MAFEVTCAERVVEVGIADLERQTGSYDRRAPLELVQGDVNARVVEALQRSFDAHALNQPLEGVEIDAGTLKEWQIGTPAALEHATPDDGEKRLGTPRELLLYASSAVPERQRLRHERSEAPPVA